MKKMKLFLMTTLLMIGLVPTLNADITSEPYLSDIKVNNTTVSNFSKTNDNYEVEVETNTVTVTATAEVPTGGDSTKYVISGLENANNVAVDATNGNTFTIKVTNNTDEANATENTYTVKVTKKATTTPSEPTTPEKTEEEKFNELVEEIKNAIKSNPDSEGYEVSSADFSTKTIYFEVEEKLEDGTVVKVNFNVKLTEEVNDAEKVLLQAVNELESGNYDLKIYPIDNVITKEILEIMQDEGTSFGFEGGSSRDIYWNFNVNAKENIEDLVDVKLNVLAGDEVNADLKKAIEGLLVDKTKSLVLDFAHSGKLPQGTSVSVYVGDKFKDGTTLSLFYYNTTGKKLEEKVKNIKVENGYVTFDLEHCSSYVLAQTTNNAATGTTNVVLYGGVLLAAISGIAVLLKKKNN